VWATSDRHIMCQPLSFQYVSRVLSGEAIDESFGFRTRIRFAVREHRRLRG
jgi:hypothetical protein